MKDLDCGISSLIRTQHSGLSIVSRVLDKISLAIFPSTVIHAAPVLVSASEPLDTYTETL